MKTNTRVMTFVGVLVLAASLTFGQQSASQLLKRIREIEKDRPRLSQTSGSPIGQWEGWIGMSSNPSSMERCSVSIAKGVNGGWTAAVERKGLGMVVSSGSGGMSLGQLKVEPFGMGMYSVQMEINGRKELVEFTRSRQGNIAYLSGTTRSGLEFHLWQGNPVSPVMPAKW